MRRAIALAAVVAIALGAGVGLSGCGSSGFDSSSVAQAAQSTQAAGTARVALSATVAGQTLRGEGFLDMKARAADLWLALPQGSIREIYQGTRFYMKLPPALRRGPLADKPWASFDVAKVAKAKGIDISALQSIGDPSRTVDQLRAAGQVQKVGTETVRGVKTTHFKAVIDLRKAAARAPASQRAAAERSIEVLISQLGRSTIPVEVWIDDQKRLRRERFAMPILGQQIAINVDLYDFGVRHAVTPPPAGQVTDVTALASRRQP